MTTEARQSQTSNHPLLVIAGPTGSGKSGLALALASRFGGEVVNCDSIQIYRYFDIGAAKLLEHERHGIPHHLIDYCNPDVLMTAGEYSRLAREVLRNIKNKGKLPIVCGGTGFYFKALLEGLSPSPERDENLRRRLVGREERRPGSVHRILSRLDPVAAARIQPQDVNKTIRALEIRLLGGKPGLELMANNQERLVGFRTLKIGLNPSRRLLHERINARCSAMFADGLVAEVKGILDRGYSRAVKPLESIGYRECLRFLDGEMSLENALVETQTHSRQYAKRQLTWFRRDREIKWVEQFGDSTAGLLEATELVGNFLA